MRAYNLFEEIKRDYTEVFNRYPPLTEESAERDAEVHKVHELVMLRHCCLLLCGARAQLLAFTCLVHKVHERSARKCLGCIYNRIDT